MSRTPTVTADPATADPTSTDPTSTDAAASPGGPGVRDRQPTVSQPDGAAADGAVLNGAAPDGAAADGAAGRPDQRDRPVPRRPRISPAALADLLGLPVPTPEQQAVITAPLRPAVVVAGAGSGKTETMSARVVWLVANGFVAPDRVLGLTFTNKAAAELAERIRIRLSQLRVHSAHLGSDADFGEPTVLTYHAYAARLVGEHALRIAVEPSVRLLSQAMTWQLAQRVVRSYDGDLPSVDQAEATVVDWVLDLAGQLAEHLVTVADLREWTDRFAARIAGLPRGKKSPGEPYAEVRKMLRACAARREVLPLVELYEKQKRAAGAMDFGDQMSLAARIATQSPEAGRAERARFSVVLLDEYQDTSHAQITLLRELFGARHAVTAVGDPCQSIYGWRGASVGNLTRFPEHFAPAGGPRAAVLPLGTSFRNDRAILDVANRVSEPLRATGLDVGVLAPGPRSGAGEVRCALLSTVEEEAEWLADEVEGVWTADAPARAKGARGRSVAVLARRRSQFERIERALRARNIPVEVVGLGGLLATPEVRDVVSTLRVLSDPDAGDALMRLLTGARWRIGPRDLVALGRRARDLVREPGRGPGRTESSVRSGPDDRAERAAAPESGVSSGQSAVSEGADSAGAGSEGVGSEAAVAEPFVLDREEGSIVEALDDLGGPDGYSRDGYRRLEALRRELAALRRRTNQSLPDLVADVERTLRLDVEVAAHTPHGADAAPAGRPGRGASALRGRAAGHVHLDRFLDVAAQFAADAETPTLGAFLAYLAAAEVQERGLEPGRVEVDDECVQVLTVHASKGLEWDVVAVPGLTKQVFPDRDAVGGAGWMNSPGQLPYALRGDVADLPGFEPAAAGDQSDVEDARKAFVERSRARGELEERRLAYVALTRARSRLLCSGYWWDEAVRPRGPSPFLEEVREVCLAGAGHLDRWADEPDGDAHNPLLATAREHPWPVDPLGDRRPAVEQGADLVRTALARLNGHGHGPASGPTHPRTVEGGQSDGVGVGVGTGVADPGNGPAGPDESDRPAGSDGRQEALFDPDEQSWSQEVELLLAERARRMSGGPVEVPMPGHLTVSALVVLRRDPAELARQIRRPMPFRPAPLARRGTAFHAWLEDHYGGERLLDLDELPGAADEDAAPDEDLAALRDRFLDSEWADRRPYEVEVPFEAHLGGLLVRGRMDAVFRDEHGGYDVIDWKTGARPVGTAMRAAEIQLAAYRLAWAQLAGVPVERVRAGFHYVRENQTVRPADLADADRLSALVESVDSLEFPG